MLRARFKVFHEDYRPVNWPIKHPYWCTGSGDDYWIVVAYADDEDEILNNWPEASDIDSEEASEYVFNARFNKPDWFKERK